MQSYLNNTKLKQQVLKEIEKHRKADQIEQGTYGKQNGSWRGCAVSCTLRSLAILNNQELVESYSNHKDYETLLGIPEWLARLEDTIFEGLPVKEAKLWPEQFAKAIPVGVDLDPVKWKFCAFILKENIERVLTLKISDDLKKQVVDAIRQTLKVHETAVETGNWDESAAWSAASAAWSAASAARSAELAARSAARSAAWSAAWSARSAARSAAWSAAWSAESAARSAAWSAESAARSAWSAWSATRSAEYTKYSKKLLRLLKQTK